MYGQEVGPTWPLHCGYHLRTGGVEALNDVCHWVWGIAVKTSVTSACAAIWQTVSRQPRYWSWSFKGQHTRQTLRCIFKALLKLYAMRSERGRDLKCLYMWLCSSIRYGPPNCAIVVQAWRTYIREHRIVLHKRCGYTYTRIELHCTICRYTYIHTYPREATTHHDYLPRLLGCK